MTNPTSEFWQAISRIGGDSADRLRWRTLAPTAAPAFHQAGLLREAGPADVVYRSTADGREQCYRIVRHAGSVVGVDVDDEEAVLEIDARDAVDWAVDWVTVRSYLVMGLGLEAQDLAVRGLPGCWRVGCVLLDAGVPVAVYLATPASTAGMVRAIDIIAAGTDLPAVILVPDASALGGEVAARARQRRVSVVGMAQRVAQRDRLLIGYPDRDAVFAELLGWLDLGFGNQPRFLFRADGDCWEVRFGSDASTRVRHRKGMLYLHILLQQPGARIHVRKLKSVVDKTDESAFKGGMGSQDMKAELKALMERLAEIRAERDEAEGEHDAAAMRRLDQEHEAIRREVRFKTGLDGKERPKDDGEKARQSVAKAIKDAIDAIRENLPALADHLAASMDYGYQISYAPKGSPPAWVM